MPLYEYRCPNGHLLEVFHGMNEPSPTVCEVCGASPLERVLHPVAVHYKGSGFYSTDYGRGGRKGGKDGGSGDSGSSSGSGSSESGSSDSGSSKSGSGGSGESSGGSSGGDSSSSSGSSS
jgi:putative FmdB family regulatory protein